uniref:Uncharacterized protein n=1 Tax=Arundo donax TaxID=35708 RepID=A0A0A9FCM6_ARUDO
MVIPEILYILAGISTAAINITIEHPVQYWHCDIFLALVNEFKTA